MSASPVLVVGMDESPDAAIALRWAMDAARRSGGRVRAVMAWTPLRQHHLDPHSGDDADYSEADAAAALEHYVSSAVAAGPAEVAVAEVAVEMEVAPGQPGPVLVEESDGAEMLVVGSQGYGGIVGSIVGSVSQHCMHHARCPVAVVPPLPEITETSSGRIVVGVDGSVASREALVWAADQARRRGATLEVVHAWTPPAYPLRTLRLADPDAFERAANELVDELLVEVGLDGTGAGVARLVVPSTSPSGALLDRAPDADMVVVGTRGAGGFGAMLLGSVPAQLAQHARAVVVVVPTVGR